MMTTTGGCLCKAVRFSFNTSPVAARTCWCRLCQYLAAGNATVNICFKAESLTESGEVRWYESEADSGNHMRRGFCPVCGTPLYSKTQSRPHLIFVRAGTLDNPNLMPPQGTIWVKEAPDWACINPDLPRWDGQSPPVA